jgi:hypothetical protein
MDAPLIAAACFVLVAGAVFLLRQARRGGATRGHLLIYDQRDIIRLRPVGLRLERGCRGWWGSQAVEIVRTFLHLIGRLEGLGPPRLVLLVTHGSPEGELFWLSGESPPVRNLLPLAFWDTSAGPVGVWALGCYTARWYERHASGVPIPTFLGYGEAIHFNFLTAQSQKVTLRLLCELADVFRTSQEIDEELRDRILDVYDEALLRIGPDPDEGGGNRLTRAYIMAQIKSLELWREGSRESA